MCAHISPQNDTNTPLCNLVLNTHGSVPSLQITFYEEYLKKIHIVSPTSLHVPFPLCESS